MWGKVSALLGVTKAEEQGNNDLQLATAALLVHVSLSDGEFSSDEKTTLLACLIEHFGLTASVSETILANAEKEKEDAHCLYKFTRAISKELDQEGRQDIIRLLWQVAFADNHIDNFEANIIAKIGGLLGVSSRDRIQIKHEVQAES